MKKWLQTYTGFLRNIRFLHFIYNYINRKKLQHNKVLYQKYGIKKSVYASISSKDFKNKSAKLPWLDYPIKKEEIEAHPKFMAFDAAIQQALLKWHENGYLILPAFFDNAAIEDINKEVDLLLETDMLRFNYTNKKVMNAFEYSEKISAAINHKGLKNILEFILDKKVEVFQSINFIRGSEQALHSDSLHMMTFPKGNLIAVWIALEDIYMDAGAIEYFPKSHHLPYLTNEDIGAKNNCLFLDSMSNKKNEAKVAELIKTHHLPGEIFLAKKGDALVWHANLLHGGLPILNPQLTRKSMVAHYFAKDVICYHEISERPALFI